MCLQSSGLRHELSILLHWQASFYFSPGTMQVIYSKFSWPREAVYILNIIIFCRMGLKRHLTAAEIVEQAVFARRLLTSEVGSITNVVFMVSQPFQTQ